jgi:hypothetical protein
VAAAAERRTSEAFIAVLVKQQYSVTTLPEEIGCCRTIEELHGRRQAGRLSAIQPAYL